MKRKLPSKPDRGAQTARDNSPRTSGRSTARNLLLLIVLLVAAAGVALYGMRYLRGPRNSTQQQEARVAPTPDPSRKEIDEPAKDGRDTDREERRAVYPPGPPTAEGLKQETLDVGRRLVADFPGQADPLGLMGMACAKLGQQAEAVTWYQRSLDLNPNLAEAYHMMAEASIRQGEFELAVQRYRKALEINPKLPGVHGRLGQTLMELGRPEEAVAALETELKNHPNAVGMEFPLGQAYMQLKQYEEAIRHLERASRHMPGDPLPYYALAKAYARLGQRDKAREFNEKFRQLRVAEDQAQREGRKKDSDLVVMCEIAANIHTGAGQIHAGKGRQQRAEEHWRRAAFLDKKNRLCRQLLSQLYMSRNQWAEALEICRELLRIDPNNAVYHLNTGVALGYLMKLDESEEAIRHALRLDPRQVAAYHSLLQVLMHDNRKLPEAKAVAEELVELEPKAENYVLLGNLCQQTGDRAGALDAMERARQLAPGNP